MVTVRVKACAKVAVTDLSAFIRTSHVADVPVQAPLQPVKIEPEAAVAVSLTVVPEV
ncbi:MAG: hypothetical protein QXX19_07635 [Candidatus Caldarchaeum sp.]